MSRFYIFSHQGGWDEILMVVTPIFIVWCILAAANRRAKRKEEIIDGELPK